MKLTTSDIELLKSWGYSQKDMSQIQEAILRSSYELYEKKTDKTQFVSATKAISILGRERFLSGIGRSAFHWSSSRETKTHVVSFDSRILFK